MKIFSNTDDTINLNNKCTICLMDFENEEELKILNKCNHLFHTECLDGWLNNEKVCPICKSDVIG